MKKNTLRTLWLSLTVMLIFCIIVFTGLANYTVTQSDRAIGEVGEIYMDQMGTQVKMHFTTMIELRSRVPLRIPSRPGRTWPPWPVRRGFTS